MKQPRFAMFVAAAAFAAAPLGLRADGPAAPDPATATSLTVAQARALVARQADRPSASVPLAEAARLLESVGVSREAAERLLVEARALEPLGGADEVMLLEFLHRARSPEWLAIRGRFREFLDLPALERPEGDVLAALLANGDQVTLSGVHDLEVDAAEAVATAEAGSLSLPALERLAPAAAAALAESKIWLDLRGLRALEPGVAAALATHKGKGLSLGGITSLQAETARILAEHTGHMSLRNLASLSAAAAAALADKAGGDLYLTGLRELKSPDLAARLARQPEVGVQLVDSLPVAVAAALAAGHTVNPRQSLLVSGRAVTDPAAAEALAPYGGQLFLCGDFDLDAATARRLAGSAAQRLCFRGLTRLEPEAARALATFPRELRFPRLVELPREAAEALAAHAGPLDLSGLTSLPPDAIAAVVQHRARLDLKGITTLTPAVARALAARKGDLVLPGLALFDVEVAAALATHEGPALVLGGVTTLPADVAGALADYRGQHLDLPSLVTLDSVPLATRLAVRGRCLVPRLASISPEVATALATRQADLALPGLATPGADVAAALATHRIGVLNLPGVREVPDDVAAALANHRGASLEMSGLVRLDSVALARRFASQEKCTLRSLAELTPDTALVLASRPRDLTLPGVRVLTREVAAELATHRGVLSLPGLETMDADVAEALATHRGGGLGLHGMRTIDALAAILLAEHEDPIDLQGLMLAERIESPEVAALLAKKQPNITLPHVVRFDAPQSRLVAEQLALTRGRLALPGLKAISPATLRALLAKPDADIPEIETLELIPEPDGRATDDFVDPRPEELRRRRQREFRGLE